MAPKLNPMWLSQEKVEAALRIEPALLLLCIAAGTYLFYRLLRARLSNDRQKMLRDLFRNLLVHTLFGCVLFALYWMLRPFNEKLDGIGSVASYIGLMAMIWGAIILVKTCRILAFEYLFLTNMNVGVPVLVVNLLSLLLSLVLGGWILSSLFDVNLAPLLATSAIFSIVLGLALQDTLGNLFAGVALQFDKPYEIGDWIEIQTPTQRWQGQVREITWRATFLVAFTEEIITVPNRVMAQAEVCNFSAKIRPFLRGHYFRLRHGQDPDKVRELLLKSIEGVEGILEKPEPIVLLIDSTEFWANYKLIYYIQEYGKQYVIGSEVQIRALRYFKEAGITFAPHRFQLTDRSPSDPLPLA